MKLVEKLIVFGGGVAVGMYVMSNHTYRAVSRVLLEAYKEELQKKKDKS